MNEEIIKRRGRIIPTRTPFSVEIKKSIFQLIFVLLIIIVMISIVFLLNSSQDSQKGYTLKQHEIQRNQLNEQGRDLINSIIQAQSTSTIQNNPLIKEMVKAENLIYLQK